MGLGDMALSRLRNSGTSAAPYAGFATYINFKNQVYAENGTAKALSAITGYSFTDNVDNVPNINASGYQALNSQASALSVDNPFDADADFIWWVVVTLPANTDGDTDILLSNRGGGGSLVQLDRESNNSWRVLGPTVFAGVLGSTPGRAAVLYRRRGGKDTAGANVGGVVTVVAESGATVLTLNSGSTFHIGHAGNGTECPSDGFIEGVYAKAGTFSDGDLNAILTAI